MAPVLAHTDANGAEFVSCLSTNSTRRPGSERRILSCVDREPISAHRDGKRHRSSFLRAVFGLIIRTLRALLLAVLVLLEPIVQPLLCATALLAFGTALFFRFLVGDPAFPFSGMLALSLLCILLLGLYYRVVRFLY